VTVGDVGLTDFGRKFLNLRIISHGQLGSCELVDTDLWLHSFRKLSERIDDPFISFLGQKSVECVAEYLFKYLKAVIIATTYPVTTSMNLSPCLRL
jgi:hypothetical protein